MPVAYLCYIVRRVRNVCVPHGKPRRRKRQTFRRGCRLSRHGAKALSPILGLAAHAPIFCPEPSAPDTTRGLNPGVMTPLLVSGQPLRGPEGGMIDASS